MMIRTLFVTLFFVPFTATAQPASPAPATAPVADIFAPVTIKSLMRKACDYQLAEQAQPLTEKRRRKNDWIRAAFYTGVMAAYHQTQDPHYFNAALAWSKDSNFTPHDRRHADDEACGQIYTELYFLEKDASMIEPLRRRFDELMATEKPGRVEWWWCDALYMSPPALARLAKATGERKYLDYIDRTWWGAPALPYDKAESEYDQHSVTTCG
jgi:rhamnogalacturonyl hydrolase YesR